MAVTWDAQPRRPRRWGQEQVGLSGETRVFFALGHMPGSWRTSRDAAARSVLPVALA